MAASTSGPRPVRHHYSTAVEGGAPVCLRMRIAGRLAPGPYLAFVRERAAWLDLSGWASAPADGIVEIVAAGPEALVGALEMACTLGPADAVVEHIETSTGPAGVSPGFTLR